ncbi:hypothetical protein G4B88_023029 [Cannabis sativa]|uniref:RNase H type-1 domain-containing protein n=1 Tax=Cannabis sativa TaxID=3483 RepID=A0A7J6I0M5_CANSA|nr:hypothetical protein G4B88_023029 [Cannabis sativa]
MLEKPQHMEQPDITMEDLLARTTNLTVLEDEGWEVNGDGDSEVASLCAMGRWCSTRPISRSLLKTILGRVWGISERNWSVEIKHTTKSASFLVFSFKSSQDLNRILIKNPWFLNNGNMDRLAGFAGQIIHVQKADAPKIAAKGYFTFKVRHDIAKPIFPGFLFPWEGRKVWLHYRPTSSTMQPMNHVLNASGNPSIDFNASTTMMPRVSSSISLNKAAGNVGKGKEIENEHNLNLTPTAMEAPNHILNSGVGLAMGKMNDGQGSSKRDGSWREESCVELIGELTQHQSNYTPRTQQNLRNNNMEDMPILIDIPISYDTSFASLNKGEGSSKRRKVIPKRSKIKGGTGSKEQEEDICHALWCCPKVQKLWKQLGYSKFKDQNTHNASNFLWWQWEHLTKEEFFRFVGFSWLIWQRRNNYIFQHKVSDNKYWIPWALETIEQHLGMKHQPTVAHTPSASTTWQPPPKDMVIINTDASLVQGQEGCGLSAVIRDDKGSLIVAETMFIAGCLSVKLAEAAAIQLGLRLAERWSISKAWVASDSKVLITAIENGDPFPTDWGQLVQNINHMKSHFQLLHFLFYSRNCNKVANSLAKRSHMTQKSETWTDCLPYCAAACLIVDVPSAA